MVPAARVISLQTASQPTGLEPPGGSTATPYQLPLGLGHGGWAPIISSNGLPSSRLWSCQDHALCYCGVAALFIRSLLAKGRINVPCYLGSAPSRLASPWACSMTARPPMGVSKKVALLLMKRLSLDCGARPCGASA